LAELLDEELPQLVAGLEALLVDEPLDELLPQPVEGLVVAGLLDDELLEELLDDELLEELLDDELLDPLPSLAVLIVRKETRTRLVMMFFMTCILND
jgi:hypothetical protein